MSLSWLKRIREHLANNRQVACSDCFQDEGLRIGAIQRGQASRRACQRCGSKTGHQLRYHQLYDLHVDYLWGGTFKRVDFGGASQIVTNPWRYGEREVDFAPWTIDDVHAIEDILQVGAFHYGPPLWRVGEIEPLQELRRKGTRRRAANRVISRFPSRVLPAGTKFYRLRMQMASGDEQNVGQYDAPPDNLLGRGRLDDVGLPVLYGSPELEVCVHECKLTIPDEAYVATLETNRAFKMLDLSAEIFEESVTEFESVELAMRFLFTAGPHCYEITRSISRAAKILGFDGIIYPSYYGLVRDTPSVNYAFFDRPISDNRVTVRCINRATLRSVKYAITLGPLFN
jgi:hypothetical protein